ncbi:MAG TPA: alpha/beta hydrolase [Gammaproteobacteria bacterium]|nr:alpha/beta hydrolase [Gammaproteobacteria bacterium]HIL94461.1 alpha/beta hydrolase [Pseudomonadales bacterium]
MLNIHQVPLMENYLTNNGCRLWTVSNGSGIPVIMCNGGPGCDDYLGDVSSMIEDHCQVVRFEPRGCGRSDYDGQYELETTLRDIEFIRDEYGFARALLIGHSFGPDVALAYSLAYENRTLGIIGISGGRIVNDRQWSAIYRKNLEMVGEVNAKEYIADPLVNETGVASWRRFIQQPDLLGKISKIKFPVTYISAGADIRPNWPTQQLAGLIPNGEYREIPGATHNIWLTHADELRQCLRSVTKSFLL